MTLNHGKKVKNFMKTPSVIKEKITANFYSAVSLPLHGKVLQMRICLPNLQGKALHTVLSHFCLFHFCAMKSLRLCTEFKTAIGRNLLVSF